MRRAAAAAMGLALFATACRGEPAFRKDDLPRIVLQKSDAPVGTVYVEGSSGFRPLEQYAEDAAEVQQMQAAGFQTSFIAEFLSPGLIRRGTPNTISPEGAYAISFAVLFRNPEGARRGMRVLEADVRHDGSGLQKRATTGLPDEALGLFGSFDPNLPGVGYLFTWRRGNAVLGVQMTGAAGAINEFAARSLAIRMAGRS